ncbi:MAG TPA: hypothetical protein PLY87_15365, partial [Planctomycetaceae bacterium]|nr:hypothetical protein [Planctomycetaceae bacterium]
WRSSSPCAAFPQSAEKSDCNDTDIKTDLNDGHSGSSCLGWMDRPFYVVDIHRGLIGTLTA